MMKAIRLQDKHYQTVVLNSVPRTASVTNVQLRKGVMTGRVVGYKVAKVAKLFSASGVWEQKS